MGRMIGKTVVLREYRREDLSAIRSWINDGETTRYLGGSFRRPQTWEQTETMLERRLNGDVGGEGFVIADRESMAYLGQCDLMMIDNVARRAEIAVVLLPGARGRGMAFEGLSLLLSYAFDTLNLNRVWLRCARGKHARNFAVRAAGLPAGGYIARGSVHRRTCAGRDCDGDFCEASFPEEGYERGENGHAAAGGAHAAGDAGRICRAGTAARAPGGRFGA